jgi:hypothetical protein
MEPDSFQLVAVKGPFGIFPFRAFRMVRFGKGSQPSAMDAVAKDWGKALPVDHWMADLDVFHFVED